jgi:hypothetical protein
MNGATIQTWYTKYSQELDVRTTLNAQGIDVVPRATDATLVYPNDGGEHLTLPLRRPSIERQRRVSHSVDDLGEGQEDDQYNGNDNEWDDRVNVDPRAAGEGNEGGGGQRGDVDERVAGMTKEEKKEYYRAHDWKEFIDANGKDPSDGYGRELIRKYRAQLAGLPPPPSRKKKRARENGGEGEGEGEREGEGGAQKKVKPCREEVKADDEPPEVRIASNNWEMKFACPYIPGNEGYFRVRKAVGRDSQGENIPSDLKHWWTGQRDACVQCQNDFNSNPADTRSVTDMHREAHMAAHNLWKSLLWKETDLTLRLKKDYDRQLQREEGGEAEGGGIAEGGL